MANRVNANKTSIFIGILLTVLVATGTYFGIRKVFSKPSFDKQLIEAAAELNKKCPQSVDEETRLDNTEALPGNIFKYNYTLINYTKEELNLDTLRKNLEPSIVNSVKSIPELKLFRDNKVIMSYDYKDKNGVPLVKIDVGPDKYDSK